GGHDARLARDDERLRRLSGDDDALEHERTFTHVPRDDDLRVVVAAGDDDFRITERRSGYRFEHHERANRLQRIFTAASRSRYDRCCEGTKNPGASRDPRLRAWLSSHVNSRSPSPRPTIPRVGGSRIGHMTDRFSPENFDVTIRPTPPRV